MSKGQRLIQGVIEIEVNAEIASPVSVVFQGRDMLCPAEHNQRCNWHPFDPERDLVDPPETNKSR